ncbi:MAG: hypothetical protein IIZ94_00465 [Prevotella sp.]|jgi:hypothetical protein|nr:hypothetical protein [Prevotella sp.]
MKKILVYLLVCMSCTVVRAQMQPHWTSVPIGDKTMICTCVLRIDGVEQANPNLELGVFSNDGVCRGTKFPKQVPTTGTWAYQLVIKGIEGFTYTFKVYDHDAQQELSLTPMTSIAYEARAILGKAKNPYVLDFTSKEILLETKPVEIETSE